MQNQHKRSRPDAMPATPKHENGEGDFHGKPSWTDTISATSDYGNNEGDFHGKRYPSIDIAIVGIGLLYPGAKDLMTFWRNILEGRDFITETPSTHWSMADYHEKNTTREDKIHCNRGAFIPEIVFDPVAFGLPPRLLQSTDVVQLLSLHVAKQAIGDTVSLSREKVSRERISVILGSSGPTQLATHMGAKIQKPVWLNVMKQNGIPENKAEKICETIFQQYNAWDEDIFPGYLNNIVAGRIANRFDFRGMNCTVDAACGSSLGAIHMAIQELILGTSDLVLTGGADASNMPASFFSFERTHALSIAGDCRPFSADADGTVLGEGIGMITLRRVEDAERDNDKIYAVIKGVGCSSDGRSNSIYGPSAHGQSLAIRNAYESAGYSLKDVELIEAHGTGTQAGDRVEFQGLIKAYGKLDSCKLEADALDSGESKLDELNHGALQPDALKLGELKPGALKPGSLKSDKYESDGLEPDDRQRCALGSVKSQIGHTKSAAGVAGVIKSALALYHNILPPMIKVSRPHPDMAIETSPFYLNTASRPWIHELGNPRKAGVSSFGFGGSNFHVAMAEYMGKGIKPGKIQNYPTQLLLFSAPDMDGLGREVDGVLFKLDLEPYTGLARQTIAHFDHSAPKRLAILAPDAAMFKATAEKAMALISKNPDNALSVSDRFHYGTVENQLLEINNDLPDSVHYGTRENVAGDIAFIFPGQGSQYVNMGSDVAMAFPEAGKVWDRSVDCPCFQGKKLHRVVFPVPVFEDSDKAAQMAELTETHWAQPAIGAMSASLLKLLTLLGITPNYVAGHSYGEVTALYAAGAIADFEDFITISRKRGELMSAAASTFSRSIPVPNPMTPSGAMTAIFAPLSVVEKMLLVGDLDLSIANINAPEQIVISGCVEEIEKAEKILDEQSINYRRLPVSAAFHSKQIYDSVRPFHAFLRKTAFHSPGIPVSSNATGTLYPDDPDAIREALAAQLTSPVRFVEQIENLYRLGVRVFIEVGPHTVLSKLVDECLAGREHYTVALDRKGKNGVASFLNAMAMLSSLGIEVAYGNLIKGLMDDETPEPKKYSPVTLKINGSLLTRQRLNPKEDPPINMNTTASMKNQNLNRESLIRSVPASDSNWLFTILELQKKAAEAQDTFQKTLTESHVAFLESSEEIFRMLSAGGNLSPITTPDISSKLKISDITGTSKTSDTIAASKISDITGASKTSDISEGFGTSARVDISQKSQPSNISTHISTDYDTNMTGMDSQKLENNPTKTENGAVMQGIEMTTGRTAGATVTATQDKPDLKEILIDIVSDKTGYPPEMLELDMELESDLGIDSIKRVEILAALKEKLPELGDANVSHVASLKTLREILAFSSKANEINSVNKTETDFTRTPKSDPIDTTATEALLSKQHGSHVPIDGSHVPIEGDQRLCFRHIVVNKALHSKSETNSHAKSETKIDQLRSETKNSTLPSGTLYIIADKKGIAAILCRQLGEIHPNVKVVKDVQLLKALPKSPGNVIFMKGLDLTHESDFDTCERYLKDAFDAARLCGRNNHEKPGLFVTIQDSGGDFGLCNHLREGGDLGMAIHLGENAWAMGFSGLVKSCAREWPNACVKAIDINCHDISYEETAKRIFHEIVYENCNLVEIGIRADGARSTPETIPSESIERNHFLNKNDVVVVTGGARGITAASILALSQHCQLRIAILGRTILEDEPVEFSECLTEAELKQALYRQNSENSQSIGNSRNIENSKSIGSSQNIGNCENSEDVQHITSIEKNESGRKSLAAEIGGRAKSILAIREVRKNIAALEEKGSDVLYYSVDMAEEDAVERVIHDIRNQWGDIHGIIHGAGVIADTLIHEKTDGQYERVVNTKIRGLRALLSATKTDELTHICCFSSIAARFGNSGQTDYAMANEVLNKVCRREYVRRGGKCLVKSINWGPWEGGMVTPFLKSQFEARGIPLISLEEGTRRFVEEMGFKDEHAVEVVIGSFDSGMGNLKNEMKHLKSETQNLTSETGKRERDVKSLENNTGNGKRAIGNLESAS